MLGRSVSLMSTWKRMNRNELGLLQRVSCYLEEITARIA
jgi:hypothetical protein